MFHFCVFYFLKDFYLFIFREGKGGKHQRVVVSHVPPIGNPASNPGLCPDWELNQRPFDSQAGTQSTEPNQPELFFIFLKFYVL